ncbi:MAG: hypothetical protein AB7G11_15565 [Phycisphaerales bacterium]
MGTHSCGSGGCSGPARDLRRAPASGEVVNRPCCGGRDLGPLQDHEGPSDDDIARFGDVTQKCPECRAELYDDAEVCWKCGCAISGGATRTRPIPTWMLVSAAVGCVGFIIIMISR